MLYVLGLASCHTHRQSSFVHCRFQPTKLEVSVYREAPLPQSAIAIVPVEQPGFHESNFEAVSRKKSLSFLPWALDAHRRNWSQFRCRISLFWQLPTEATLYEPVFFLENVGLHTPSAGFGGPSSSPAFCCTTFIDSEAICPNYGQAPRTIEGMSPSPRFSFSERKIH